MNKDNFVDYYDKYGLKVTESQEVLSKLFDEHVPIEGKAKTVFGEIVRAINRIAYRYYNDGDLIGMDYGVETCSPSARYLQYYTDKNIAYHIKDLTKHNYYVNKEYENRLEDLCFMIVEFLCFNNQLLEVENTEDCYEFKADGYNDFDFVDYEEDEDEW